MIFGAAARHSVVSCAVAGQPHTLPESSLTDFGALIQFRTIFVAFLEPRRACCAMMSAIEEAHPFMAHQSIRPSHPDSRAEFLATLPFSQSEVVGVK